MFDIGFAELLIIAVVGLLVIGPERLPGAIRTGSAWLNRFRRGFNDLKREVQQELHNDSVMEELRKTSQQVREEAERWRSGDPSASRTGSDGSPAADPTAGSDTASPEGGDRARAGDDDDR